MKAILNIRSRLVPAVSWIALAIVVAFVDPASAVVHPEGWSAPFGQRGGPGISSDTRSDASVWSATLHEGELWVAGAFQWVDQKYARSLARWDGTQWQVTDWAQDAWVEFVYSDGERLYAFEPFALHVLSGEAWSVEECAFEIIYSMVRHDGELHVLARVRDPGVRQAVFRLRDGEWRELPVTLYRTAPSRGALLHLASVSGDLLLTGSFSEVEGSPTPGIAVLGPDDSWSPGPFAVGDASLFPGAHLGEPVAYRDGFVAASSVRFLENGEITPVVYWDGSRWNELAGLPPHVPTTQTSVQVIRGRVHMLIPFQIGTNIGARIYRIGPRQYELLAESPGSCNFSWLLERPEGGLYVVAAHLDRLQGIGPLVENGAAFSVEEGRVRALTADPNLEPGLQSTALLLSSPMGVLFAGYHYDGEVVAVGQERAGRLEPMSGVAFGAGAGGVEGAVTDGTGETYLWGEMVSTQDGRLYGLMRWDNVRWEPVPEFAGRPVHRAVNLGERTLIFYQGESYRSSAKIIEPDGSWSDYPFQHGATRFVDEGGNLVFKGRWFTNGVAHGEPGRFYRWDGSGDPELVPGIRSEYYNTTELTLIDGNLAMIDVWVDLIIDSGGVELPTQFAILVEGQWKPGPLPEVGPSEDIRFLGHHQDKPIMAVDRPRETSVGFQTDRQRVLHYLEDGTWHSFATLGVASSARVPVSDGRSMYFSGTGGREGFRTTHLLVWTGDIGSPRGPGRGVGPVSRPGSKLPDAMGTLAGNGRPSLTTLQSGRGEIRFELSDVPARVHAEVVVFDLRGRLVRRLSVPPVASGPLVWDGQDGTGSPVASGVYLLRASVGRDVLTKKALLVR